MSHASIPNHDLEISFDDKPRWQVADNRRYGWQHLETTARYGMSLRAPGVLHLRKEIDWTIGEKPDVARFLSVPHFSAFVVVRGDRVVYESYAPDFGPKQPHSIQSITKTTLNLMLGRAIAEGLVDLDEKVGTYLPEIGSGYADATVRDVANMSVVNDYTEDWADPESAVFDMDAAIGWRLPRAGQGDLTLRPFLRSITATRSGERSEALDYKSSNTEILAWIVERTSGRPLRDWLIDIVEAAGLEEALHISCDRAGVPVLAGGASLTARDLARYGLLFARGGEGVDGRRVGDAAFIQATLEDTHGHSWGTSRGFLRYSHQLATDGTTLGHPGWGGEYLLVNPQTDTAVVYFSVFENATAIDDDFAVALINMMTAVSEG